MTCSYKTKLNYIIILIEINNLRSNHNIEQIKLENMHDYLTFVGFGFPFGAMELN